MYYGHLGNKRHHKVFMVLLIPCRVNPISNKKGSAPSPWCIISDVHLVDATGEAWWKDAAATTGALWQSSLWIIGVVWFIAPSELELVASRSWVLISKDIVDRLSVTFAIFEMLIETELSLAARQYLKMRQISSNHGLYGKRADWRSARWLPPVHWQ